MSRPCPSDKDKYIAFYQLPTRWMDNDQYGHMNNVIHYSLIDTVVTNWQIDQDLFDTSGADIRFLVVESGCRYHAEARYPDLIHAGLRVGHIGNSSWSYEVGLFRNEDPLAFAEGFFSQVQVDARSGKPTGLSDQFRKRLEQLLLPPD
jgi:acyl-CoA thioester hydrolase